MNATLHALDRYLHLAAAAEERALPEYTERFLVLAAATAVRVPRWDIAESCRQRLLRFSPNHPWAQPIPIVDLARSPEFRRAAAGLQHLYPTPKCDYLLARFYYLGYSGRHGYGELLSLEPAKMAATERTAESEPILPLPAPLPAFTPAISYHSETAVVLRPASYTWPLVGMFVLGSVYGAGLAALLLRGW